MAALHSALQALGPCTFADVPKDQAALESYISDLFLQAQLIVESVPLPDQDEATSRQRSQTVSSVASNASEMSSSSARSAPAAPEYIALQKEWGKPIKLTAKENPLNMSVHKLGGKDGKGAWFARRSVHEGLGFAKFKRGLEREFPESLAVQGAPGEGNIRGIGGERKVEDTKVGNKGRLEVYQLSAQFPGPTTPRDFVTFLVTSTKAMKDAPQSQIPQLSPRHYMIISKPCVHPKCAPRDGFIRGYYESVEFIREIPRAPKKSASATHFDRLPHDSHALEKDLLLRNAAKKSLVGPSLHENKSIEDVSTDRHLRLSDQNSSSRESSVSRKRSVTVGLPRSQSTHVKQEAFEPEENPVEWIMITRSDPGGSVPRFMVERGTPSSIVSDALKFLNWACQKKHPEEEKDESDPQEVQHTTQQEGLPSLQTNGTLSGIEEASQTLKQGVPVAGAPQPVPTTEESVSQSQESPAEALVQPLAKPSPEPLASSGILASVTGVVASTLSNYAPQVVLDRLPGTPMRSATPAQHSVPLMTEPFPAAEITPPAAAAAVAEDDGTTSIYSSTSFASADSHLFSDDEGAPSLSSISSPTKDKDGNSISNNKPTLTAHEKELAKLQQRRLALDAKLAAARDKANKEADSQTAREREAVKKAEEKHAREVRKHEERYQKELAKLEAKKEKETRRLEERKRKTVDRDEKARLTRERDEARQELDVLRKERDIMLRQVGELQKENTRLTSALGKLDKEALVGVSGANGVGAAGGTTTTPPPPAGVSTPRLRGLTGASGGGEENRSRSSSLNFRKAAEKEAEVGRVSTT